MFDLPFSYGARRRAIERRRQSLETAPEQAEMRDVVDLLRRMGVSPGDAGWLVGRAAGDGVEPCALWVRLRRLSPAGPGTLPRTSLGREELLAAATGPVTVTTARGATAQPFARYWRRAS